MCGNITGMLSDEIKRKSEDLLVLFSTPILSDAKQRCDRIAVLHDGKITLSGTFFKYTFVEDL